jgi:hypothetical protein
MRNASPEFISLRRQSPKTSWQPLRLISDGYRDCAAARWPYNLLAREVGDGGHLHLDRADIDVASLRASRHSTETFEKRPVLYHASKARFTLLKKIARRSGVV